MLKYGEYCSSDKINCKYDLKRDSIKSNNYEKYCILSLITKKASRKVSTSTNDTNLVNPFAFDYDINDIKKLDENSISLSDISNLDLDADEEMLKKHQDSFNSSDDEINKNEEEEEIVISKKSVKRNTLNKGEQLEYDKQLDKDLIEIKKELANRRRFSVQVDYLKKNGF